MVTHLSAERSAATKPNISRRSRSAAMTVPKPKRSIPSGPADKTVISVPPQGACSSLISFQCEVAEPFSVSHNAVEL